MARSRSAAAVPVESEDKQIAQWYADLLERTTPPVDLAWEPVKVGPTWQWHDGWLLPEVTLGWGVLSWAGSWLRDKHGQPWQYTAEQARFILWYYALDESGAFAYHSAALQRLKGWGKDPVAATMALSAMFAPVTFDYWEGDRPVGRDEPNAWIQVVAVAKEQTKNTMKLMPSLVSPEMRRKYGCQVGKENVYGLSDTRQIQAVTANPLSIEGGRPTLVIRNETQNWNASNAGHDMAGAIEGNAAKSEGGAARMLDIFNAYRPGEDSVAERVREGWEMTQGDDPQAADYGLLYDSLEAPPDAPLTSEAAASVVEAVRGDATWLDVRGRIMASILNPSNSPSESRRKWYNQITATEDSWLTPAEFDLCADSTRDVADGERVFLFFDGSKSDDASALVGCCESDGHVFLVRVWQRPPRSNRGDWVVDRDAVDRVVRDTVGRFTVVGLFGDPSDARDDETGERFWEPYMDEWARDFSLEMPAVKSGPRKHQVIWDMRQPSNVQTFTEHAERFTSDVGDRRVTHDGSALLVQHVRNARRRPNKWGVSLGKEHRESRRKIDAAVCAVGARMMRQMFSMSTPEKKRSGKVW